MKLYEVTSKTKRYEKVEKCFIIAADEKHAERLARVVYWRYWKNVVSVKEADMDTEQIIGADKWYGRDGAL